MIRRILPSRSLAAHASFLSLHCISQGREWERHPGYVAERVSFFFLCRVFVCMCAIVYWLDGDAKNLESGSV